MAMFQANVNMKFIAVAMFETCAVKIDRKLHL